MKTIEMKRTLSAVVFPFHERAASDRLYENT